MKNNILTIAILGALVAGSVLLDIEYGLLDNDPIIIIQSSESAASKQPSVTILPTQSATEAADAQANATVSSPTLVEPESAQPLDFKISYVYRSNKSFKLMTEGEILHSEDHYKIIFTPMEDCYVYLFQKDSANLIFQLFPMERFKQHQLNNMNPVQRRQTYYLPSKDKSFVLDNQTGTETIYFLATRERDTALEKQLEQLQVAQSHNDAVQLQMAQTQLIATIQQKGIKALVNDTETHSWITKQETFTVQQQQLNDICQQCVHVFSFQHQ